MYGTARVPAGLGPPSGGYSPSPSPSRRLSRLDGLTKRILPDYVGYLYGYPVVFVPGLRGGNELGNGVGNANTASRINELRGFLTFPETGTGVAERITNDFKRLHA